MNKIKQFFKQDCYFYSMLFGLMVFNFGMKFFLPSDIGFVGGIPFLVMGYLPFYSIYVGMYIKGKDNAESYFEDVGYINYIFPFMYSFLYFMTMSVLDSLVHMFVLHFVWLFAVTATVYILTQGVINYSSFEEEEPKLFQMSFSLDEQNSAFLEKHSLLMGKTKEETIEEFIKLGSWCYEHIDSENTIAVINRVTKLVEKER